MKGPGSPPLIAPKGQNTHHSVLKAISDLYGGDDLSAQVHKHGRSHHVQQHKGCPCKFIHLGDEIDGLMLQRFWENLHLLS